MSDKISVTTRNSYGSRVKSSFGKIFRWILFIIGSIILLARNEHRSIEQKKALQEWAEIVQETVSTEIDTSLEWKEIHTYWETASNAESLKDSTFGIIVDDLKLSRNVSMYQRNESSQEHCTDNLGWSEDCETTYTYDKDREDMPIDSSKFYESAWHTNPTNWAFESQEREKSPITLWEYTLDSMFVSKLTDYTTINLNDQEITVPAWYNAKKDTVESNEEEKADSVEANNDNYLYGENSEESSSYNFYIYDKYIYIWKNPDTPEVWDLKIYFSSVKTWTISVIWQQLWNEITSYTTSNDRTIALLESGKVSAENMFLHAQQANKILTRLLRILWLILMYSGFNMIFEFITTLAKVLPFLSKLIWISTGIVSFFITLILGFLTIWIARIAVRPVVWITCLVIVAAWIYCLVKFKKNKKSDTNNTGTEDKKENTHKDEWQEVIEC